MSINELSYLLQDHEIDTTVSGNYITIDYEGKTFNVFINKDWKEAIDNYFQKSGDVNFISNQRLLKTADYYEFQIIRLHPDILSRPDYSFENEFEQIQIGESTKLFSLSLFKHENDNVLNFIKRLLNRRITNLKRIEKRRSNNRKSPEYKIERLLPLPDTILYKSKNADNISIEDVRKKIKAVLFKLALSGEGCWELKETIKSNEFSIPNINPVELDEVIPKAVYDDNMVAFYKVATSSIFPTQTYLAYYHILEYNFLKVTDENLFTKLKGQINQPNFKGNYDNINSLLSTIKRHDQFYDETEMLKEVLKKYIDEESFISYVKDIENKVGENIYSKPSIKLFGKDLKITLKINHALSNTASALKLIRNALVHSSDKYERSDRIIPFSKQEELVIKYRPLIKYLAEKVIFASASN